MKNVMGFLVAHTKEQAKAWSEANKEAVLAYKKAYREANKELVAARDKAYKQANKESVSARRKARYQAIRQEYVDLQISFYKECEGGSDGSN